MLVEKTIIPGVFLIHNFSASDNRGLFVKTFQEDAFKKNGLRTDFKECYFSVSEKDVIRGMHFQLPPYHHAKLVFVTAGEIEDVVLDLRKDSKTFNKFLVLNLETGKSIYIPAGCAHGFKAKSVATIVVYMVTSEYAPQHDAGIRYDSFGHDWQVSNPVISDRDLGFVSLQEFQSPF